MNDTISITEKGTELIKRRSEFPVNFEAGSPFGISGSATIVEGAEEIESEILSPEDSLARLLSMPDLSEATSSIFDEQLQRWLVVLARMPRNPHLLNNVGMTYLSKGDVEAAIAYFTKALAERGDFRLARANLAKAYVMQGKFDEALAIYLEEQKRSPQDSKLLMNLARLYLVKGEIKLAKEKLDQIISTEPENSGAYHNRGIIRLVKHELNEAISDFRKAILIDERSVATHNALGVCYVLRSTHKRAIKYLTIAHGIDRANIVIIKNLANAYQLAGCFEEATKLMEEHLLHYPMDVDARDIAALSYLKWKDYRHSLLHLVYLVKNREQLSLKVNDLARVYNNIGVVHSNSGNFVQAIEFYKESIERCNEEHMCIPYSNLTRVYLQSGRVKDAESLVNEYLNREPREYFPLILLANYYFGNDEYSRSHELLNHVLQKQDENVEALVLLTAIYGEAFENSDKALETAERAYRLKPSEPTVANNLAYVYLEKGRLSEAKNILNQGQWQKDYFVVYATKGLLQIMEGKIREGTQLYDKAEHLARGTEMKRLVRQKKHVELARHYLVTGKSAEVRSELGRALSIKTTRELYRSQAERLLEEIG